MVSLWSNPPSLSARLVIRLYVVEIYIYGSNTICHIAAYVIRSIITTYITLFRYANRFSYFTPMIMYIMYRAVARYCQEGSCKWRNITTDGVLEHFESSWEILGTQKNNYLK